MHRKRSIDPRRPARGKEAGFTLIEAVMVIVLTGVVIAVVAVFIVPATTAYFASSARAQLTEQADTAMRRIARDLTAALPNSVRVTGNARSVELIPVSSAARYATASGDPLLFGTADSRFSIIGPPLRISRANQPLAWYNLGASTPDANAYTLSNVRTATSGVGNASTIDFTGAILPVTLMAPPYRVYAIDPPVTYRCDLAAGTLTRFTGYGFQSSQPDPPSGGSSAILARNVSACSFAYDNAALAVRYGLATLTLSLTSNGETITLYQAVHVDNLP